MWEILKYTHCIREQQNISIENAENLYQNLKRKWEGSGNTAVKTWSPITSILWMKGVAAVVRTHLGGQGAASGLSCHHICYTHWSRAAGTHPPAPTLRRWSTPPCSRQTVASPLPESQPGSQTVLRSARSAEAAFELWRRGEETGRRPRRFGQEASSYRRGKIRSVFLLLIKMEISH